jgi:putative transposase
MTRPTDFQSASPEEWQLACRREAIIRPLAEADRLSRVQVDQAAKALGLGRSATYELIARFKQRPQTSSLLLAKVGRPRSLRLLDPQVEAVIEEAIKTFYLSPQRPRLRALVREIARRCEEQKLPVPTFRTVRGRLAALDPQQVTKARLGWSTTIISPNRVASAENVTEWMIVVGLFFSCSRS